MELNSLHIKYNHFQSQNEITRLLIGCSSFKSFSTFKSSHIQNINFKMISLNSEAVIMDR